VPALIWAEDCMSTILATQNLLQPVYHGY
jgi:hypothetical protein